MAKLLSPFRAESAQLLVYKSQGRIQGARTIIKASAPSFFQKQAAIRNLPRNYVLLVVPVVTFGLGTWQLYRLRWKLGMIDERTTRMRVRPLTMEELPDNIDKLRDLEFRRVKLTGTFDHDREIYLLPRSPTDSQSPAGGGIFSSSSHHGAHVITPFKITDTNTTVLIDRGWVPKNQVNPASRAKGQVQGETTVIGAIRNSERRNSFVPDDEPGSRSFLVRDIDAMSKALQTAPLLLEATKETDTPGGPIGGQTTINLRNEHLNYAITWYSLSVITAFLWYYKYVKGKSFR